MQFKKTNKAMSILTGALIALSCTTLSVNARTFVQDYKPVEDSKGKPTFIQSALNIADQDDLHERDSFHPPKKGQKDKASNYNEWHYMNIVDSSQDLAISLILIVEGDPNDAKNSYSLDTIAYNTADESRLILDIHGIDKSSFGSESPDVSIAKSSIEFKGNHYEVNTESADGSTTFNAHIFPTIDHDGTYTVPVGERVGNEKGYMTWFLSAPGMRTYGNLTINKGTPNEKVFKLIDAKAYHDHNWGYWKWKNDMGWDWGQVSELPLNDHDKILCEEVAGMDDCNRYAMSIFNYTNSDDTVSRNRIIRLWQNGTKIQQFEADEVKVENVKTTTSQCLKDNHFPAVTTIKTKGKDGMIDASFYIERYSPLFLPTPRGFRIIWELNGFYEVEAEKNGEKMSFKTDGVMEYFGKELVLSKKGDQAEIGKKIEKIGYCFATSPNRLVRGEI